MTIPTIGALPDAPSTASPDDFDAKADAFLAALATLRTQINSTSAAMDLLGSGMAAAALGGGTAIAYTFSTTTTDADPGTGKIRFGSATQNTATVVRMDLLDKNGIDWTNFLNTFDDSTSTVNGYLRVQKSSDGSAFILFSVSALATPSGYRNVTVSPVISSASNPFANNDDVTVFFVPNGDKGDTGATGATGASAAPFVDSTPLLKGSADATKQVRFEVDGLTTATTRVVNVPDRDGTMAMLSDLSSSGLVCLAVATASNSATIDFTSGIDSTYAEYELHLINILPTGGAHTALLRVSTDGGSTWKASGEYSVTNITMTTAGGSVAAFGTTGANHISLGGGAAAVDNTASGGGLSARIRIFDPSSGTHNTQFEYRAGWSSDGSTGLIQNNGFAAFISSTAVNGLRILMDSGNIASGMAKLFGVRKAV